MKLVMMISSLFLLLAVSACASQPKIVYVDRPVYLDKQDPVKNRAEKEKELLDKSARGEGLTEAEMDFLGAVNVPFQGTDWAEFERTQDRIFGPRKQ